MPAWRTISLWMDQLDEPLLARPALEHDLEVDVAIIGAGYTGLWTAYYLKRLAPGLRVEALAPDGLIEAFSMAEAPGFSLCVQWHPEWQAERNPHSMALLQAFGRACRDYREQIHQPRHDSLRDPET